MKRKGLAAFLMLAVALLGATLLGIVILEAPSHRYVPRPPDPSAAGVPIARVQDRAISRLDLQLLKEMRRIRSSEPYPDYGFLREFLEHAVYEELLRRFGAGLTAKEVQAERERIDRETKDPETLQKLKNLLEAYPGKYEWLNVRPALANNKLHGLFNTHRAIQARPYREANDLLQKALEDPLSLAKESGTRHLKHQRVDSRRPSSDALPDMGGQHRLDVTGFVQNHLATLKPGDVLPHVIDLESAYVVARLLERNDEYAAYEAVTFPKEKFEPWLRDRLRSIRIDVLDGRLREEIREKARGNAILDRAAGRD
ncbi:MAG: hypothetical protein HY716_16660 [Planctomycetes bacterium]|nr:hypothetical protein [Planctomycetota bacterium]